MVGKPAFGAHPATPICYTVVRYTYVDADRESTRGGREVPYRNYLLDLLGGAGHSYESAPGVWACPLRCTPAAREK